MSPAPGPTSPSRRRARRAVLRQAVDCLAPLGTCGVIGAPAFGTEVVLDVNTILVAGRTVRGVVEGDSVPQTFLPQLVRFWEQGRFPVERLDDLLRLRSHPGRGARRGERRGDQARFADELKR